MIIYEWTLETLDECDDVIDSDFSETLSFNKEDIQCNRLGLIRRDGNKYDGEQERVWAYVNNGKLPEYFSDEIGNPISIKMPKKFHNELLTKIKSNA